MFDLSHLQGLSFSFGISRRRVSIRKKGTAACGVGGVGRKDKRNDLEIGAWEVYHFELEGERSFQSYRFIKLLVIKPYSLGISYAGLNRLTQK